MNLEIISMLCATVGVIALARFWVFFTNPIAAFISKHMKEGWLKRLLFISWET